MNLKRLKTNDQGFKSESGQTLVEVLIAFAVTVIIGVGLVTAGLATQRAAGSARNEAQATKIAQEYVERLRAMRDSKGWSTFMQPLGSGNGGDYVIQVGDELAVSTWTLAGSWADPAGYCIGPTAGNNPLEGVATPFNNIDYCKKVIITRASADATGATFRVEVGWMEGNNVKNVRAETVLSKWCTSIVTGANASPCPN